MNKADLSALWARASEVFPLGQESIHGPSHWRRVERNGLFLARSSGADPLVVRLFALFHDSLRQNESIDPGHGSRGAELALSWHAQGVFKLDQGRLSLLCTACRHHTDMTHHSDPTVATCFDADRLDLGRVGIMPDQDFLNTQAGRDIARRRAFDEVEAWWAKRVGRN